MVIKELEKAKLPPQECDCGGRHPIQHVERALETLDAIRIELIHARDVLDDTNICVCEADVPEELGIHSKQDHFIFHIGCAINELKKEVLHGNQGK